MARSRTRRRPAPRRARKTDVPWLPIALGLGALGVGAAVVLGAQGARAATPPSPAAVSVATASRRAGPAASETVRSAQTELAYLTPPGSSAPYYAGSADGVASPGGPTQAAIRAFQGDNGLPATGSLDAATASALDAAYATYVNLRELAESGGSAPVSGPTAADIGRAQVNLTTLGFPVSETNVLDAATVSALGQYQESQALPHTGALDAATLASLDYNARVFSAPAARAAQGRRRWTPAGWRAA